MRGVRAAAVVVTALDLLLARAARVAPERNGTLRTDLAAAAVAEAVTPVARVTVALQATTAVAVVVPDGPMVSAETGQPGS